MQFPEQNGPGGGLSAAQVDGRISVSFGAIQAPLDKRIPVRSLSKVWDSQSGAPTSLVAIDLGDSLASREPMNSFFSLDRAMGGRGSEVTYNPNSAGTFANGAVGYDVIASTATGTVTSETDYAKWPVTYTRIASGGSLQFIAGGVNPVFTDVAAMCIKIPGGGAAGIQVAGVEVASVSTAGTSGIVYPSASQALAQASVVITATGGDVLIGFVHVRDLTASGLDTYSSFGQGGLLLANAIQSQVNWQAALAALPTVDLITSHWDDDFGTDAPSTAAMLTMLTMLDTACPLADKVLCSGTPRQDNDAGKQAQDAWLRGQVAARGANYLFYGSYSPLGSYANMVAQGLQGDGVHASSKAFGLLGDDMYRKLGFNGQMGWTPRPVNMRASPSYLGSGTSIGAQKANAGTQADLRFTAISPGFDWEISTGRSITFKGTNGKITAQFSGSASVVNVLPDIYDVGTVGDVKKIVFGAMNSRQYFQVKDTARTIGFGGVYAAAFFPAGNTAANTQTDYPANTTPGIITFQSDGIASLGAGNYVSNKNSHRKLLAALSWTSSGSGPAGSDGYFTIDVAGTEKKVYTYP